MPGFKLTPKLIDKLIKAVLLGDLLQKMLHKNRAYEIHKGDTDKVFNTWMEKSKKLVTNCTLILFEPSIDV